MNSFQAVDNIDPSPTSSKRKDDLIPVISLKRQKGKDVYYVEANKNYVACLRRKIVPSMRQQTAKTEQSSSKYIKCLQKMDKI